MLRENRNMRNIRKKEENGNLRRTLTRDTALAVLVLTAVTAAGALVREAGMETNLAEKLQAPGLMHWFGTDMLGRDMFCRTLAGLSLSIRFGLVTACFSAVLAGILGVAAAIGPRAVNSAVSWFIDLILGIPHLLLLLLISFACGAGFTGVAAGVILTHWMSLARLLRAEVLHLKAQPYIQMASKLGSSRWKIAWHHCAPHLLPQFCTGLVLLFPHAILHESSVTFLGFGLPAEEAAIGIILSESMGYLMTGKWWLAFFPGAALVLAVLLFYRLGETLNRLFDPGSAHA